MGVNKLVIDEKKLIKRLQKCIESADNSNFVNGLLSSIDIIKQQPKISEWILCSERLPDEATPLKLFLVCYTGGGIDIAKYDYDTTNEYKSFWVNFVRKDNVIAWMPLPKPYGINEHPRIIS